MYKQRNSQRVAYICDLKTCGGACRNDMCHHTFDISHAANFECLNPDSDEKLYFEKENTGMIKDSGKRTEFETGAVRDLREGKGRCDLMPLHVIAQTFQSVGDGAADVFTYLDDFVNSKSVVYLYIILREVIGMSNGQTIANMFLDVAIHFEEGAKKYGENNWQKGIPVHCYLDSAIRHYLKSIRGDDDEPHMRAFIWNIMCCIWTCENRPELIDI